MGELGDPKKGSDFVYVDAADAAFVCSLCSAPAYSPWESPCEHLFCCHCAEAHREKTGEAGCPKCGEGAELAGWRKAPKYVQQYLGNLKVKCTRRHANGAMCEHVFTRDAFVQHSSVCNYKKIACPMRCGETLYRCDLRAHEEGCEAKRNAAGGGGFHWAPQGPAPQAFETPKKAPPMWSMNGTTPDAAMEAESPPPANETSPYHFELNKDGFGSAKKRKPQKKTRVPQQTHAVPQPQQVPTQWFNPAPSSSDTSPSRSTSDHTMGEPPLSNPAAPAAPQSAPTSDFPPTPERPAGFAINIDAFGSTKKRKPRVTKGRPQASKPAMDAAQPDPPAESQMEPEAPRPVPQPQPQAPPTKEPSAHPPMPVPEPEKTQVTKKQRAPSPTMLPSAAPASNTSAPSRNHAPSGPTKAKRLKVDADNCYEAGNYEEAIDLWGQSIKEVLAGDQGTKLHIVYGNRSAAYFMSNQFRLCVDDCKSALETDPDNEKLWLRQGKATFKTGDAAAAVRILKKALERAKPFPLVRAELQLYEKVLTALKKCEELIALKRFKDVHPIIDGITDDRVNDYPELILLQAEAARGEASTMRLRAEQACKSCDQLMVGMVRTGFQPVPHSGKVVARACYIKACVVLRAGFNSLTEAKEILKAGLLAINSDSARKEIMELRERINKIDEIKFKGNEAYKASNWQQAEGLYGKGIALCADVPELARECGKVFYTNRAAARKEMGQLKACVADCDEAIKLDSCFFRALTRRARCYMDLSDYVKAVEDFKRVVELEPSSDSRRQLDEARQKRDARKKDDHYTLLGVAKNFDAKDAVVMKQMKRKYQELCMRWHPDKVLAEERAQAEQKFKEVQEAYSVLTDPELRRKYDKENAPRAYTRANTYHANMQRPYGSGSRYPAGAQHPNGAHHGGWRGYNPGAGAFGL
eukprot:TRINITY_DN5407_c0_g1_i1.p1 TRINITY_DN5407_c0_g1~~TRINITY_DN5407_c0_g1_i1.p1  ORF type:complete len:943 (+),score=277.21 TRINITY_DN5407_c0_g1_i1:62-2830(+)